jgi:hypothetical protein
MFEHVAHLIICHVGSLIRFFRIVVVVTIASGRAKMFVCIQGPVLSSMILVTMLALNLGVVAPFVAASITEVLVTFAAAIAIAIGGRLIVTFTLVVTVTVTVIVTGSVVFKSLTELELLKILDSGIPRHNVRIHTCT